MSTITRTSGRASNDLSFARIAYDNKISGTTTFGADAALIPNTWERWAFSDGAAIGLFQISPATTVNYVAIAAHNFFTAGVTSVTIQLTTTAGSGYFTACIYPVTSDSPIFCNLDDFANIAEVRVTFTGGTGRELGVIYAGEAMVMQQALYGGHTPITLASVTDYRNAMSDTGQFLGRTIRRRGQSTSFAWQNLTEQWYRDTFKPFVDRAKTTPFFIQWRPDYQPTEVAFGYTTGDIAPNNQGGVTRLLSVSLSMRAYDE